MTELALERDMRRALKAQAHALDAMVLLGASGLTPAVLAEVDRALTAHSLIKVRVPLDDRTEREAIFAAIADKLAAARVQAIGKLVVLFRPPPVDVQPAEEPIVSPPARRAPERKQSRPKKARRARRQT